MFDNVDSKVQKNLMESSKELVESVQVSHETQEDEFIKVTIEGKENCSSVSVYLASKLCL